MMMTEQERSREVQWQIGLLLSVYAAMGYKFAHFRLFTLLADVHWVGGFDVQWDLREYHK